MTTITQEEIATRIPHRYENLLLDKQLWLAIQAVSLA